FAPRMSRSQTVERESRRHRGEPGRGIPNLTCRAALPTNPGILHDIGSVTATAQESVRQCEQPPALLLEMIDPLDSCHKRAILPVNLIEKNICNLESIITSLGSLPQQKPYTASSILCGTVDWNTASSN